MRNRADVIVLCVVGLMCVTTHAQERAEGETPLEELMATPVSTAARYEQRLMDTAASVTVITAEEIERYGYTTLADALNSVRGLYLRDDRNYTTLGLRGFSRSGDYNNRFLVMIDGHPTNESVFGSAAVGTDLPFPMAEIERIEVVRGPGSVLYGSGAMLGVINVVTKRTSADEGVHAEAGAGSRGLRRGLATFSTTWREVAARFSVTRQSVEGTDLAFPELTDGSFRGMVQGLDFDDSWSALATITRGDVRATGYALHRRKGIPTASFGTLAGVYSDTVDERQLVDVRYEPRLSSRLAIASRVSWGRYEYRGIYPYSDGAIVDEAHAEKAIAELQFLIDPRPNHRTTAGVQFVDEIRSRYVVNGADYANESRNIFSLYIQHEYQPVRTLSLIAGIRHDAEAEVTARATPRLAVVYQPRRTTSLKLLYGTAFRLPTPWERYDAPEGGYKGNDSLRDEHIRTIEAVWEEQFSGNVFGTVSAYEFLMQDLIEAVIDPADGLIQSVNRGNVRGRGIELEVTRRLGSGLWLYANASIQRAGEGGDRLTNSPSLVAMAGASAPLTARLSAAVEAIHESGRRTLSGSETSPFTVLNAKARARLTPHLSAALRVMNLFDETYAVPGGLEHRQDAIYQDGRTIVFNLEYTH